MAEEKKRRRQFTKTEKRILAEETTRVAFGDEAKRKTERDAKTEKLRAIRLARDQSIS
jgi:hypothetical protein